MSDTLYNVMRTRTFSEIIADPQDPNAPEGSQSGYNYFAWFFANCGIPSRLLSGTGYTNYGLTTIYALLMTRYANSHIKSSDEAHFKLEMMMTIFQHGNTWQKLEFLQDKLHALSDAELIAGTAVTYNHANNPDVQPGTSTVDSLTFIDEQNKTLYQNAKADAYAKTMPWLTADITEDFLARFKPLFVTVAYDPEPLLYVTEDET